jgi:hypothetical protein
MKLKLLFCGAALILAAGCASQQSAYPTSGSLMCETDLVPSPLPDLTPTDLERIEEGPVIADPSLRLHAMSQGGENVSSSGQ